MGYLFVAGALLAGLTKGFCGKKTSGMIRGLKATFLFNALRMIVCVPVGLIFLIRSQSSPAVSWQELAVSGMSGVFTALFVMSWIACVREGAYMMVDTFVTLGTAVPVILCCLLFRESIRPVQIAGIALLAAAAYIMCSYDREIKGAKSAFTLKKALLLAACGLSNGMTMFSQKLFILKCGSGVPVFNFYTYIFAAAVLTVCWLAARSGEKETFSPKAKMTLGAYVVLMALCIFLHSFFSTSAAGYLPSAQLYPLMQGSALILSMVMCALFFGERITPRGLIGMGTAFAALLLINVF